MARSTEKTLSFRGKKIAVIGDAILDRFLEGFVTRKSSEANAPVVLWQKQKDVLGGAANVAANIKTLGGTPYLFSVVGNDADGVALRKLLANSNIAHHLIIDQERTSTLKTRIFADGAYLLRLDREVENPISKAVAKKLLAKILHSQDSFDAFVLSDYNKGVLTKPLIQAIILLARKLQIPVIADVKPANLSRFKGVSLIKPNKIEAIAMTGTSDLRLAGKKISDRLHSDVLITRGSKGMLLYERRPKKYTVIKGIRIKLKDIVGAGDVVSACFSLGLASGETLPDAASLANIAAALSVEKHGTSTVTDSEINYFLKKHGK